MIFWYILVHTAYEANFQYDTVTRVSRLSTVKNHHWAGIHIISYLIQHAKTPWSASVHSYLPRNCFHIAFLLFEDGSHVQLLLRDISDHRWDFQRWSFIGICLCVILKPLWHPPILYVKKCKNHPNPNGSQIDLPQKPKCVVSRGSPPRKTWNDQLLGFIHLWDESNWDPAGLDFHVFFFGKTAQTDPFWGETSIPTFAKLSPKAVASLLMA